MTDHLQLRIVTPRRQLLDEQVREVTAPGTAGQFGVLPEHITFLSSLETGPLTYRADRGGRTVAVRGGFAEVSDNVMTVLADAAELPEEIDVSHAEEDLRQARARLDATSPLEEEHAQAAADCAWAETRLEVAGKRP